MPGRIARWKDVWARFSGRGTYPHELASLLLIPLRSAILSPSQLVSQLQLTASSRVLEVGPGPGFFSVAVARAVSRGRLDLVDIQLEMLGHARRRLQDAGVRHAAFTQASAVQLPFRDAVFDVAFLVAVLGEVPDPAACLTSIARVLKPGGRLVIAELPGDPDVLTADQLQEFVVGTSLSFRSSNRASRAIITTFENTGN